MANRVLLEIEVALRTGGIPAARQALEREMAAIRSKAAATPAGQSAVRATSADINRARVEAEAAIVRGVKAGDLPAKAGEAMRREIQATVAALQREIEAMRGGKFTALRPADVERRVGEAAATRQSQIDTSPEQANRDAARQAGLARLRAARAEDAAAAALAARTPAEREAAAQARRTIEVEQRLDRALDARLRNEGRNPDLWQRVQARVHTKAGLPAPDPFEFQGASEAIGAAALTTARFAISGAAIYGITRSVTELVHEVDALDLSLAGVEDHMRAIGQGDQFAGVRREIIGMSGDLGVAANEIADVTSQMIGAFREQGGLPRALAETRAAFKVSLVTGIPQTELTDSLTGIALSYGKTIEDVANLSLGLESRFGVLARETLKVFGDVGPTAKEAGLSLEQLGAIAAAVQQRSGRSGASIAEAFGRVVPAIQDSALAIVQLYQSTPALQGKADQVTEALAAGETGKVLVQLTEDYDKLTSTQQKYVTSLLGGRREAPFLNALFASRGTIIAELNTRQNDNNRLNERYDTVSQSLTRTLARLHQELLGIGQKLAELGVLDVFKVMAGGALLAVNAISRLLDLFISLNDRTHGTLGTLIAVAFAIKSIELAMLALARVRAIGIVAQVLGGGAGGAAAEAGGGIAGAAVRGGVIGRLLGSFGAAGGRAVPGLGGLPTAGLGAAGGALAGGATLGLGAAALAIWHHNVDQFSKLRDSAEKQAAATRKSYQNMSLEALHFGVQNNTFGASGSGLKDFTRSGLLGGRFSPVQFLTGGKTDREITTKLYKEETARQFQEAAGRGLFSGTLSEGQLKDLQARVQSGKDIDKAYNLIAGLGEKNRRALEKAMAGQDQVKSDLKAKGARQQLALADLLPTFQAGEISWAEFVKQSEAQVRALEQLGSGGNTDMMAKAIAARRNLNQQVAQQALAIASANAQIRQLSGQSVADAAAANITELRTLLAPQWQKGSIFRPPTAKPAVLQDNASRQQAATQILQDQQSIFNDAIQHASGAEAAALARRGWKMDATTAATLRQLGVTIAEDTLRLDPDALHQVVLRGVDDRIARRHANQGANLGARASALQALQDARDRLAAANPGRETDDARIAINEANASLAQLARDSADANAELAKAMHPADRMRNIQIDLATANRQLADARQRGDPTEITQAKAAVQNAKNAMADLVKAFAESAAQLAIAIAQANGETVKVAQLQLAEAQRKLREAQASGLKGHELDALQADVATQKANAVNVARQDRVGDLDWLFEQDKITAGYFIAQLQAELASIPEANKDARREIERRIKQLRDDMGKDLHFNLPENIAPTLYEGRRLTQGGYGSIGALTPGAQSNTDSRTVNIVLNANNAIDGEAAVQRIVDELNKPSRFGVRPRAVMA